VVLRIFLGASFPWESLRGDCVWRRWFVVAGACSSTPFSKFQGKPSMAPSGCKSLSASLLSAFLSLALTATAAHAVTIDWVAVGDPGNTADTDPAGVGAVATSFQIMKYEFTNQLYTDFLNSVARTDTYSLYNTNMNSSGFGGISRSGASGAYTYSVKTNMGNSPVNFVSWFDAARVSNWLMNGATSSSSTETGAYTLLGGQTSGTAPAANSGATFYVPTGDQWYKAAYYKGSGTNAGYWDYATQSNTTPTKVSAGSTGNGSAGSTGNFANFMYGVGNVTTVGTNGGPSAYGTFDMTGNIAEWNDLTGAAGSSRGRWGGNYGDNGGFFTSSSYRPDVSAALEVEYLGFRLASSLSNPSGVPEIDPAGLGSVLALVTGALGLLERRRIGRRGDRQAADGLWTSSLLHLRDEVPGAQLP
jgi:formylglycine-generating enzyme required for sulfatase activity